MQKLSAVIITFNEARNIERCLLSLVDIADEIVVIDSFSTDQTLSICERFNTRFESVKWQGFSKSKNYGNQLAKHDYILSIDADEAVSPELKSSLLEKKKKGFSGAYKFNRLSNYCGRWIHHGDWYPDTKLRLFNRNEGQWKGEIHEKVVLNDPDAVTHLSGDLYHYSYYSIDEHILRTNKYATLSANHLWRQQKKASWSKLFFSPLVQFLRSYFIKRGFMDGFIGFVIAIIISFGTFLKYAKLKMLEYPSQTH